MFYGVGRRSAAFRHQTVDVGEPVSNRHSKAGEPHHLGDPHGADLRQSGGDHPVDLLGHAGTPADGGVDVGLAAWAVLPQEHQHRDGVRIAQQADRMLLPVHGSSLPVYHEEHCEDGCHGGGCGAGHDGDCVVLLGGLGGDERREILVIVPT